ncbi:MAG: EAL domain-containing protein [Spirochaetaceae bacterium]|nr:EAL domain-containing protein [Spirochaetaceae bacterium]
MKKSVLLLVIFLFVLGIVFPVSQYKTIRIGYSETGEFIKENHGFFSGYCVEHLNEISEYTNWQYTFHNDSWENLLGMLERNEIDFVFMVHDNPELRKKFLFSPSSIGDELIGLYTSPESDLFYNDYNLIDGCSIGLLDSIPYIEAVGRLESNYNISLERKFYNSVAEIKERLLDGSLDVAILGNIFNSADDKIKLIGLSDFVPYYCITSKQNTVLMEAFREALRLLRLEDPEKESALYRKYYGNDVLSSVPLFTREQINFIKNSEPIKIYLLEDNIPMSYEEEGKLVGVYPRYLDLISEKSGLKFDVELVESDILNHYVFNSSLGNALSLQYNYNIDFLVRNNSLLKSTSVIETSHAILCLKEDNAKPKPSFAIMRKMSYLPGLIGDEQLMSNITYYGTANECLDSVINKEAAITIQEYNTSRYLLQKPEYGDKLEYVSFFESGLPVNICFVASPENEMLIDVLNKTLHYISDVEKQSIINTEFMTNPYNRTFSDSIYVHKNTIIMFIITVLGFIVFGIFFSRFVKKTKINKQELETLRKEINEDEVTKAYNKIYFFKKASQMIKHSDQKMCIVFIDIVHFKVVNELYGMNVGDKLLRHVAREIEELCKNKNFLLARFSDDHFFVCISQKDFEDIQFPMLFKSFLKNIEIKVKYGVYIINEDVPINIMCDRASMPLHDNKNSSTNYIHYYNEDDRQKILHEHEIENSMEKALTNKEFCIYIQPKYDMKTEKIVGGEALVRWIKPNNRMVPPGDFIGIFEKNGFIINLDYYVWEETCRFLSSLKEKGLPCPPISINVSRAHFYGDKLCEKLLEFVKKYNLETSDLEIEVTETLCSDTTDIIKEKSLELQSLGFKIAMDDFGSGYSSLNVLKELSIDIIKMDLKFLDGKGDDKKSRDILHSMIDLADTLNLMVVVEGVETADQVDFLKGLGSYYAQGYFYSKPVPCDVYEKMLTDSVKASNIS